LASHFFPCGGINWDIATQHKAFAMPTHVIVWDLETVPDLRGFVATNDLEGKNDDKIRAAMGDKFPKHIYHSIACIPSRALTLPG
jgi:hypothetical protein